MAELLGLGGYTVSVASNGKDGIATAHRAIHDVVLSDVSMPELYGYGVPHHLWAINPVKDLPLIFLIARTEKTDMQRSLRKGANGYLKKRFIAEQLLGVIEGCFTKTGT